MRTIPAPVVKTIVVMVSQEEPDQAAAIVVSALLDITVQMVHAFSPTQGQEAKVEAPLVAETLRLTVETAVPRLGKRGIAPRVSAVKVRSIQKMEPVVMKRSVAKEILTPDYLNVDAVNAIQDQMTSKAATLFVVLTIYLLDHSRMRQPALLSISAVSVKTVDCLLVVSKHVSAKTPARLHAGALRIKTIRPRSAKSVTKMEAGRKIAAIVKLVTTFKLAAPVIPVISLALDLLLIKNVVNQAV